MILVASVQSPEILEPDEHELANLFETEWYKKTSAEMTPAGALQRHW